MPYCIEAFQVDAAKALRFEVAAETGYKLCDFKPAYGIIFADYIKEYDFFTEIPESVSRMDDEVSSISYGLLSRMMSEAFVVLDFKR